MEIQRPHTPLRVLVIILLMVFVWTGTARAISIKEEETLGDEFLKVVLKQLKLIEDPMLTAYLNEIGKRILTHMQVQPFPYRFYLVDDDIYNAFAAPGGHIFVYRGLMEAMESEDELAGILSHEIAHVALRHISEKIKTSAKLNWATLAGVAAGILLGAAGGGEAANAVVTGSIAAGKSLSLAYSRQDEHQADEMGLNYLDKAGYSCKGLLKILKKIRDKEWYGPTVIPTYLKTHPSLEDRMVFIQTWLEDHPDHQQRSLRQNVAFARAHARLLAVYGNLDNAGNYFESQLKSSPDNRMAHYGYGLVLARSGHWDEAVGHLKKALTSDPFDPYLLRDLAEIYFHRGQYEEAEKTMQGALSIGLKDPHAQLILARIYMALHKNRDALTQLENLARTYPDFVPALYYLGQAHGNLDQAGQSHFYLGRYYLRTGNPQNAEFHLQRAAKLITDPDTLEQIRELLAKAGKQASRMRQEAAKQPVSRPK